MMVVSRQRLLVVSMVPMVLLAMHFGLQRWELQLSLERSLLPP